MDLRTHFRLLRFRDCDEASRNLWTSVNCTEKHSAALQKTAIVTLSVNVIIWHHTKAELVA
jgi:hypothetical protein